MDQQGFLPVSLIASFRRMQALTTNAALILEVKSFRRMCLESSLVNSVLPQLQSYAVKKNFSL